ncbi:MAG: helicase-related protein [Acidimicrobiales bacterium]
MSGDPAGGRSEISSSEAAQRLGISPSQIRRVLSEGLLPARQVAKRGPYGPYTAWMLEAGSVRAAFESAPPWLETMRGRTVAKETRARERISASRVRLPLRRTVPSRVEVFLGPTNSGKTHRALERLAVRGSGTYAAPLRMLAGEAYERLSARLGEESVGLVTGEERVNENAPIICSTAEMAPMQGELLVLDEVQWAADPERGWAWTRLLAGAEVDELYVTGEVGAEPLVRGVLGDDVAITWTERLTSLDVTGAVGLDAVPSRSVVVAFSRKAVLHLAGLLRERGRDVSVLYGALPPEVRREQIRAFIEGTSDVVVATDVIGHGINLPVDVVVFAETTKFDGSIRRNLADFEIAQIAGRAGRFGLSCGGLATTLSGVTGFSPDHRRVDAALTHRAGAGGRIVYRRVSRGQVAPSLLDLAAEKPTELPVALKAWGEAAAGQLAGVAWASVAPVEDLLGRAHVLSLAKTSSGSVLAHLDLDDAWRLLRAPLDAEHPGDSHILERIGRVLVGDGTFASAAVHTLGGGGVALEETARTLAGLAWATLAFGDRLGITHSEVTAALGLVVAALNVALERSVTNGVAHCVSCGTVCAPWFSQCDGCHTDYWSDDGYDEGSEWRYEEDLREQKRAARNKARRSRAAAIRDAVSRDTGLARPVNVPRKFWAEKAIPALVAIPSGPERDRLYASLVAEGLGR